MGKDVDALIPHSGWVGARYQDFFAPLATWQPVTARQRPAGLLVTGQQAGHE